MFSFIFQGFQYFQDNSAEFRSPKNKLQISGISGIPGPGQVGDLYE